MQPPPVPPEQKLRTPMIVVLVILGGLIVVGLAAGIYFWVLREPESYAGPAATVEKYFQAIAAGDSAAMKSTFTPECAPDEGFLETTSQWSQYGDFEIKDIKLKTVEESGDNAKVEVLDYTVTASMGGESISIKMSDTMKLVGDVKILVNLKKVNGQWLIDQEVTMSPVGPGVSPTPAPPSGST